MVQILILTPKLVVHEHVLIKRPIVDNDPRYIATYIPEIRESGRRVSITCNVIFGNCDGVVCFPGGESGNAELIPPTYIEDGVGEDEVFDVVVDCFFVVAEEVDSPCGDDGDESAGDEAFDPGGFGCGYEGDLGELFHGADGGDEDLNAFEGGDDGTLGGCEVAWAEFDAAVLERLVCWFGE